MVAGVLVADQDESRGGGGAKLDGDRGAGPGFPLRLQPIGAEVEVEGADAGGQAQQAQHLVVDGRLADVTVADRRDQVVAPRARGAGHNQVEAAATARDGRAGAEPVGHHHAVEAPLVFEDLAEQRVLAHGGAVDAVVGSHHRPRASLPHDRLEGGQVQLTQGALVDAHIHGMPLGLGVVGDEVLHRRRDPAGLDAAHIGGADPRGQQRILAEALEVAAAVGAAVQVHGRGEQHLDALAPGLGGQETTEALDPGLVPGGGEGAGGRHVRGRVALVPALAAHASRAVGDHHPPQPDGRFRVQRPETGASEQPHLLLQGERRQLGLELRLRLQGHPGTSGVGRPRLRGR